MPQGKEKSLIGFPSRASRSVLQPTISYSSAIGSVEAQSKCERVWPPNSNPERLSQHTCSHVKGGNPSWFFLTSCAKGLWVEMCSVLTKRDRKSTRLNSS